MSFLVFFIVFVLIATAVHVAGQPGFLSIDCGLDAEFSPQEDADTGIVYVSDGPYVDGGENHRVAAEHDSSATDERYRTLRSFPSGERNCYALPTEAGGKYLLRMVFAYGNYDGKNRLSTQFDLHLGTNYWDTYETGARNWPAEVVFVAWASWVPACLVNTGGGTPFVNTVELRKLGASLYPHVSAGQSMVMYTRISLGAGPFIRYPDDPYDRFWWPSTGPSWANVSTTSTVRPEADFAVPTAVLQTAVAPLAIANGTAPLTLVWSAINPTYLVKAFLHLADFQDSRLREFDASFDGDGQQLRRHSPTHLAASYLHSSGWYRVADGKYSFTLAPTNKSVLPPMLNAYEIYNLATHHIPATFPEDFDVIMAIKLEYGVKKNWMGDPCFPTKYAWDGVKCSTTTGNTTRIISLDLSNSSLHGVISNKFALLTALEYLNLSGNRLNGSLPDSLCKNNAGSLIFRYESDQNMCNKTFTPSSSGNRTTILLISIVVPVLAVALLVLSYVIWRQKLKPQISTQDPPREPELVAPGREKVHGDQLKNTENRRFTYKELEKFSNNFERFIGQGGFGMVYYGCLEDNTEVAIKMRSESSSHGLDEFLAEVQSLTKVHHRNLVSLVGYCWEKDHLALVYEYMSRGNLCDHLTGRNGVAETLNWGTRVRVVLEAAQGLDYLHKGCSLPIIHRDVKTSNILLGQNLQAKIADFGLCKTYLSDTQTHISTVAAGTAGYIDPEYYHTGRLTQSSDVYSFGVVLLEIVTGERPVLPNHGHIVQRVKRKIAAGNISSVTDGRLGDAYDVSSMWKIVDTALACTADEAIWRPTMAAVVVQLKASLALEETREDSGVGGSFASTVALVSTVGPSAR